MSKTLLVLCDGADGVEVARRAKELGHSVVAADADPQAPAFAFADSCLITDVHGAQETAAAAERYNRKIRKIDGVLCAADAGVTAATVSQRLRLPGLPLHVAELAFDRLAMQRAFRSAGVTQPWSAEIFTPQDLQRAMIARGRALVLRPVEHRGKAGVHYLSEEQDLAAAFQDARAASPSERVLVEEFHPPTQVAGFMLDGACHAAAAPGLRDHLGRAAAALGIPEGPVLGELVADTGEIADLSLRLSSAGDFLKAAILMAIGEAVTPQELQP
jgi:biotin carboxylase